MKTMRLFSSLALGLALILLFAGCAGPATPARAPPQPASRPMPR